MRAHKALRIVCLSAGACIVLALAVVIAINMVVFNVSQGRVFSEIPDTCSYDAIVVLGAGLRQDGSPSAMLRDRLNAAITVFEAGVSDCILLTGDCSGEDYDEVGAMYDYCIAQGIPAEVLICDGEGFSTYESMENAVTHFGLRRVIVITQEYHLYRALYVANKLGADADGYAADYRTYRGQMLRNIREYAARVKDFFVVNL